MIAKNIFSYLSCILLVCFVANTSFAQIPETLKKGTFKTTDGKTIKFSDLKAEGHSITYTPVGSSIPQTQRIAEIEELEGHDGSIAGMGFGIGAGIGLIGGLAAAQGIKNEEEQLSQNPHIIVEETNTTGVVIAFTGIGALTGFITGALIKKNRTYFKNPETGKATGYFQWDAGSHASGTGLSLKWVF